MHVGWYTDWCMTRGMTRQLAVAYLLHDPSFCLALMVPSGSATCYKYRFILHIAFVVCKHNKDWPYLPVWVKMLIGRRHAYTGIIVYAAHTVMETGKQHFNALQNVKEKTWYTWPMPMLNVIQNITASERCLRYVVRRSSCQDSLSKALTTVVHISEELVSSNFSVYASFCTSFHIVLGILFWLCPIPVSKIYQVRAFSNCPAMF